MAETNVPEAEVVTEEMPTAEPLVVAPDLYVAEDNTKDAAKQGNVQSEMTTAAEAGKK